uniref:PX domain-containing protein n=1 Tax=Peronospora matthiolae TaxID=2874970 RepID=A0AAV1V0B4_9STRA
MEKATRSKGVSMDISVQTLPDLSTLEVQIGELRLSSDGTWLYLLQVTCSRSHWQVVKRYSEIRELWLELCKTLGTGDTQRLCAEHIHFLAGFEQEVFPKKHLLLTQHKLEARASKLNQFFLKLAMRLNLCRPRELQMCRVRGCPLLELIAGFFVVDAEQVKSCALTHSSRSISLQPDRQHNQLFTDKRKVSMSVRLGVGVKFLRRVSFGFKDQRGVVAALAQ